MTWKDDVDALVERIARLDPLVHAFEHFEPSEVYAAAETAATRSAVRRPLGGLPIGVKDIFDVRGMPTTCGSNLHIRSTPIRNAGVVTRLLRAGAIVVGKTKTTPFAFADPTETRNPWDLARTPGGSSAGSAAAVACGLVGGALGSQTAGSLIRPASFCGVVGYLPSPGTVDGSGVFPLSPTFDRVGFMARSVAGVSAMYRGATERRQPKRVARARTSLSLGWLDWLAACADEPMRQLLEKARASMTSKGHTVIDVDPPARLDDALRTHNTIMRYEAALIHRPSFEIRGSEFPPKLAALVEAGISTPDSAYLDALSARRRYRSAMDTAFRVVDVLVAPGAVGAAPRGLSSTGDPMMSIPSMLADLPAMTLPFDLDADGLPLGLQLMGRRGADNDLLLVGEILEAARTTAHDFERPLEVS